MRRKAHCQPFSGPVVRVGCSRRFARIVPEEWSPGGASCRQNPAYRPADTYPFDASILSTDTPAGAPCGSGPVCAALRGMAIALRSMLLRRTLAAGILQMNPRSVGSQPPPQGHRSMGNRPTLRAGIRRDGFGPRPSAQSPADAMDRIEAYGVRRRVRGRSTERASQVPETASERIRRRFVDWPRKKLRSGNQVPCGVGAERSLSPEDARVFAAARTEPTRRDRNPPWSQIVNLNRALSPCA